MIAISKLLVAILIGTTLLCAAEKCVAQEADERVRELNERIDEAEREHRRLKRLEMLTDQKIKLLHKLKQFHASIATAEDDVEEAKDDSQIEQAER